MLKITKTQEPKSNENKTQEENRATKVIYCLVFSAPSFLLFGKPILFTSVMSLGLLIPVLKTSDLRDMRSRRDNNPNKASEEFPQRFPM
jgi:hypothetical protein